MLYHTSVKQRYNDTCRCFRYTSMKFGHFVDRIDSAERTAGIDKAKLNTPEM